MIARKLLTAIVLSIVLQPALAGEGVRFVQGELEEVKQQAMAEGKMLFVHFTADWCLPCRWMEQETYPDEELAAFMNEKFVALRLDIDEPAGYKAKQAYQVVLLPTMLVFNRRGQVAARYEESLAASQLLAKLDRVKPGDPMLAGAAETGSEAASASVINNPFPSIAEERPDDPLQSPRVVTAAAEEVMPPPRLEDRRPSFTVQLGVYRQFENAQREADRLTSVLGQEVRVHPGQLDGQPIYRVLTGGFISLALAEGFREQIAFDHELKGVVKHLDAL